jgi:hypothetical protein
MSLLGKPPESLQQLWTTLECIAMNRFKGDTVLKPKYVTHKGFGPAGFIVCLKRFWIEYGMLFSFKICGYKFRDS